MKLCLGRSILDEYASKFEQAVPGADDIVLEPDSRWSGNPDDAEIALLSISLTRNPETTAELPDVKTTRSRSARPQRLTNRKRCMPSGGGS